MGTLTYGNSGLVVEFDDRILAHLQIVIGAKLRRGEAFFFTWKGDATTAGTHASVWIEKSIPLYFLFSETSSALINRQWLESLTVSANSAQGLVLLDEPEAPPVVAAGPSGLARGTKAPPRNSAGASADSGKRGALTSSVR